MTMQTEMDPQTQLFPKTELDEANAVLDHLITEQDKADKAAESAEQKAYEAMVRVGKQRHVVAKLQSMMPAAEAMIVEHEASDVEDADFTPFAEVEGDVLDPITGEVARPMHGGAYDVGASDDGRDGDALGPLDDMADIGGEAA